MKALFVTHHHMEHEQEFIPIFAGTLHGTAAPTIVGPKGIKSPADFVQTFYQEDIAYRKANAGVSGTIPVPEVREVKVGEQFVLNGITITTAATRDDPIPPWKKSS